MKAMRWVQVIWIFNLSLPVKSVGLSKNIHQLLQAALLELVPLWQIEPHLDWKRVLRPTGEGSFSINIEPYSGVQTWIGFRKKYSELEILNLLNIEIRKHHPALLGYVIHQEGMQKIQDVFGLVMPLCKAVISKIGLGISKESAIGQVIAELNQILLKGLATQEVLTVLCGLKLPENINQIELEKNVCIRHLTADEISDMGSNDVSSESRYDFTSSFSTTALVITQPISVKLSENYEVEASNFEFSLQTQKILDSVFCALHVLKLGRVGILVSFRTIYPTILPNMSGHSSAPLIRNPFSFMELNDEEIELFVTLYKKIILNKRDEVKIASARLLDAENRLSPVDSLLDAVIGLEVLLNPNDNSELSFRVALNYAYMGNVDDRRSRYENIRDIQKTRNRVVHGGLNLGSKDAALIHEHATLAKQCLRDCVTRFLMEDAFTSNEKLDVDFWLDRVIPPKTEQIQ
ncbi:MAG: hypothetical protein WBL28_07055 [Methylotenera sp.]